MDCHFCFCFLLKLSEMTFKKLADYFAKLESTTSRLEITAILADLLKQATPEEIAKICYLSLGRLAPLYAGIEFNLAEKLLVRTLAQAFGLSETEVKKKYKSLGDLGDTAEFFDKKESAKPLTVSSVYERLWQVAKDSGKGSVERKVNKMASLVDDLDALSVRYVVRIPLGRLRLGFSELTILDALSWMIAGDKSKRVEIEKAFNVQADIGQIAKLVKARGSKGLGEIKIQLGVPIMPALCQRIPTADEMIKKMGEVAVEPKYDGTRLQLHFNRKKNFVRTFTRNLENTTAMFPDITGAIPKEIKASEVILDGEAIGFDPKNGKFLPFQETIKRKRKYEIGAKTKEIPLKYFVFDVLYKDGQDLLKTPFSKRRAILGKTLRGFDRAQPSVQAQGETIILSPQIVTEDPQELRRYHDEQKTKGLEGVVAKKWQGTYDTGRRGFSWVKFKEEEAKKGGGLADTLDCVVMGYYKGKGKRNKFGIGAFLVGIRESTAADWFVTISKIGTGLSDEQWREMYQRCEKTRAKIQPKQYKVDKNLVPDVWCEPEIMVEIQADNITKSPIHTAKYALRFPRLVQFRDDRSPLDATTLAEAEKLYKLQK